MNLGTAHIIRGNALKLPLPDATVDLICTSPPYFGLRSYQDGGQHYNGQIGSEPTHTEFLDALIAATREMIRVLKPSGSIFVNLGDKYSGGRNGQQGATGQLSDRARAKAYAQNVREIQTEIPTKSLMGIPWRYAIRCIDELSLILRAEIIWSKPNGLPESVTDRVRRSHEQWFHFVTRPRYYSAIDGIREPHADRRDLNGAKDRNDYQWARDTSGQTRQWEPMGQREYNPLGKLPGSVWTIPTQPLTVPPELGIDHFAAYPMEWPRRIIQGWSPREICTACGEGRRPTTTTTTLTGWNDRVTATGQPDGQVGFRDTLTGYACACPDTTAATTPSVILDPFGGTGTTALIAKTLGRTGINIDMSADYCRLAEWRCNNPGQLAAALQVEKPAAVHPDQLALFKEEPA